MVETRTEFVSEPMTPVPGTADVSAMSRGEPGLPSRFVWRKQEHVVADLLRTWKSSIKELGESYLKRHWYEIVTGSGLVLTIYCERQRRNPTRPKARWWVYTVSYKT